MGFEVTGCAAHSRLAPLVPEDWIDASPYGGLNDDKSPDDPRDATPTIHFLWENAPRQTTKTYRDNVAVYSHLPNGTAVLDSKWALARLLRSDDEKSFPELAILPSHCFRGRSGFIDFCGRVGMDDTPKDRNIVVGQMQPSVSNQPTPSMTSFHDIVRDETNQNDGSTPTIGNEHELPEPSNLWVVKDANANGAGGIWVVGPENAEEFRHEKRSPLIEGHRYVAQKYAWPPVLFRSRKCHVRAYGLFTADGRAFVHHRCFLHVANETFEYTSKTSKPGRPVFEPSVHITNCCANSDDPNKFAGEICADLNVDVFGRTSQDGQTIIPLAPFFPSISASVATIAQKSFPFLRGGEANNGFEYLGIDFILAYRGSQPVAYLLEVNAPPSQDTATGLRHAEDLHNEVIRDILDLWVKPKITGAAESLGGWTCVYHENDSSNSNGVKTDTSNAIVPSKAAIINKIRWALFERKRLSNESTASTTKLDDPERVQRIDPSTTRANDKGTNISQSQLHKSPSSDDIARFARSHFPYFDRIRSENGGPIFFENAGGTQVPLVVTNEIVRSLSNRNRSVNGMKAKEEARNTMKTILGVTSGTNNRNTNSNECESHEVFFGANASSLLERLSDRILRSGLIRRGDEIVLSTENHLANVLPWIDVAAQAGAMIKWWTVKQTEEEQGIAAPEAGEGLQHNEEQQAPQRSPNLDHLLTVRTRVVAISHASNTVGELRDIRSIGQTVKTKTNDAAIVVVDGVAVVPHVFADIGSIEVDWYVVSSHKLFGPHLGVLCGRKAAVDRLLCPSSSILHAQRSFEVGTTSYEACAGIVGVGHYFRVLAKLSTGVLSTPGRDLSQSGEQQGNEPTGETHRCCPVVQETPLSTEDVKMAYRWIHNAEVPLVEYMESFLGKAGRLTRIRTSRGQVRRLPIFAFVHHHLPADDIIKACSARGIQGRSSLFLSTKDIRDEFGIQNEQSVVRFSMSHYNTIQEAEWLVDTLCSIPGW